MEEIRVGWLEYYSIANQYISKGFNTLQMIAEAFEAMKGENK